MFVQRPLPQVMDVYREMLRNDSLAKDTLHQKAVQHPREQRQDIDFQ
jgi:hypothetical protein